MSDFTVLNESTLDITSSLKNATGLGSKIKKFRKIILKSSFENNKSWTLRSF